MHVQSCSSPPGPTMTSGIAIRESRAGRLAEVDARLSRTLDLPPDCHRVMPPKRALSQGTPIVFVVDEDLSLRETLESLICNAGWQPETFDSPQEFLCREQVLVPSCLVLDLALPGLNGLDLQKRLAADRKEMPIIFVAEHGDIAMAVQAMKAGALDFLAKPFCDDALLSAVRHAIERSRTRLDDEAKLRELRDRYTSLSRREREVMALVVSGLLNKQIGFELGISEITVKAHRGQVMRKMKADSLADLVKIAMKLDVSPAA